MVNTDITSHTTELPEETQEVRHMVCTRPPVVPFVVHCEDASCGMLVHGGKHPQRLEKMQRWCQQDVPRSIYEVGTL